MCVFMVSSYWYTQRKKNLLEDFSLLKKMKHLGFLKKNSFFRYCNVFLIFMFIYKCFNSLVIFNKLPFIYDLFVDVYG